MLLPNLIWNQVKPRTRCAQPKYQGEVELVGFNKRINCIDEAFFGPDLVKLIGIQKLTRLTWSGELQSFLDTHKSRSNSPVVLKGKPAEAGGVSERNQGRRFHKVWVYLSRVFDIRLMGTIGERSGIEMQLKFRSNT